MIDLTKGLSGVASGLEEVLAEVKGSRTRAVELAALALEGAAKVELSKPGRGKIRRFKAKLVTKTSKKFGETQFTAFTRASAPGDPPAVDTGRLRNSITHGVVEGEMRVGTNVEYAAALEYGTLEDDGPIAPRPFLQPALAAVQDQMTDVVVSTLRRRA